jgi:hypothetical protein
MIAECPYCESKVDCDEKGHVDIDLDSGYPTKIVLLKCKVCHNPLLGMSELFQTDHNIWDWDIASRL